MDWLQFTSSVIGSLAWPAVVAYLLYLLREQLGSLADRLSELTLPGGTKALFRQQLAAGTTGALTLAAKNESTTITPTEPSGQSSSMIIPPNEGIDIISPKQSIIKRYLDVIDHLKSRIDEAPLRLRLDPSDFIFNVMYQEQGNKDLYDTFITIRQISSSAYNAHSQSIKTEDARSYKDICAVFLASFDKEFENWLEKRSLNQ